MMKFLVLALGFCLICLSSQYQPAQVNGDWRSILVAADNVEKVEEGGELRGYVRHLQCSQLCQTITITFYAKSGGQCQKISITGTKTTDNIYITDFSGQNFFQIKYLTKNVIAFYDKNVNAQGVVTRGILLVAKGNTVSEKEKQRYEELTVKLDIPKENIRNLTASDDCPDV